MTAMYIFFSIVLSILNSSVQSTSISFTGTNNKENLRLQLEKVAGVYKNPNNTVIYDLLASQGLLGNKLLHEYLGNGRCVIFFKQIQS